MLAIQLPERTRAATEARLLAKAPGATRAEPPSRIASYARRIERPRPAERADLEAAKAAPPLPYDPAAAIRHLSAADPALARAIAHVGACALALKPRAETFAALAEAVVYQQLHAKAAATIFGRVRAAVGDPLSSKGLGAVDDATLRAAGLSANKLAALRDLAARDLAGEVPDRAALEALTDAEIVERLTRVRGIGPWTVEMLLIFRLGRPDVLPTTDYGVRQGYARAFGLADLPKPAVIAERGERWRPFRSVASWYLWRMTDGA